MNRYMIRNTFLACPNCGNIKKFRIFSSSFQIVEQSPDLGIRTFESGVLPSLRENDTYIECQSCFKKSGYDVAVDIGKKYIQKNKKP